MQKKIILTLDQCVSRVVGPGSSLVLGQDALLSQYLSSLWCKNEYQRIVNLTECCAVARVGLVSHSGRGVVILAVTSTARIAQFLLPCC